MTIILPGKKPNPLYAIALSIVNLLLVCCRLISRITVGPLSKAHYRLTKATAIKPGTVVEQTEHNGKVRRPWVVVRYNYDCGDYYLVRPKFFDSESMKEKGNPRYSAGDFVWVYPKYLTIIGRVEI